MLLLSTSAKSMAKVWDYARPPASRPLFSREASLLAQQWAQQSLPQMQERLHISENLAILNKERFIHFEQAPEVPALCLYDGDVFQPLQRERYTQAEWDYAQKTVRIFSGLYGILRACDAIKPYRLEMASRHFSGEKYSEFWQERVTQALVEGWQKGEPVVSIASQEYLASVNPQAFGEDFYHVDFRQKRKGKLESIALYGKMARGAMMNYCIQHKIQSVEALCAFQEDGYVFTGESLTKGLRTLHFVK